MMSMVLAGEKLSPEARRAKSLREKIRRGGVKIEKAIEELYQKPIEEWDLEELSRGRLRDANGLWTGMAPGWITPAVRTEARRRFQTESRAQVEGNFATALKVVAELAADDSVDLDGKPTVPASVRLNAATYIIDQTIGRATAKVEIEAGGNLRNLLAGALVLPGGKPATIIDGEVEYSDEQEELESPDEDSEDIEEH